VIFSRRRVIYIVLLLGTAVIGGVIGGFFLAVTHDLPQIQTLESFRPAAVTRIYSADKELLAEFYTQKRVPVQLEIIPDHLKQAIIATEDRQFREHAGVDLRGIVRAIITDIRVGQFVQGASTITQQLARTLFLSPRKSIVRKLKEAFLAFQIERRYTKDEILELYLNQVYRSCIPDIFRETGQRPDLGRMRAHCRHAQVAVSLFTFS
jgi:penicillin-binding protein 1A